MTRFSADPGPDAELKMLLPHIMACFDANKSVTEIIEELNKRQSSSDAKGTGSGRNSVQ